MGGQKFQQVLQISKRKDESPDSERYNARFRVKRDNHRSTVEIEHLTDKGNLNLTELLHVDIFAVGEISHPCVR
jgi:hypothetical protein